MAFINKIRAFYNSMISNRKILLLQHNNNDNQPHVTFDTYMYLKYILLRRKTAVSPSKYEYQVVDDSVISKRKMWRLRRNKSAAQHQCKDLV